MKNKKEDARQKEKKINSNGIYGVVLRNRYHPEDSSIINMLICRNYYIDQIRKQIGINKNLTFEKVSELFQHNQKILVDINNLNTEMAQLLGLKYLPPGGYK